jgi:hypothetical protein
MSKHENNETPEVSTTQGWDKVDGGTEQLINAVKPIDSYFSIEHQGMISAKYRAKYSDADQTQHKAAWPEFVGNHFTMYILAETLGEARKAVFSANSKIFLNQLIAGMVNYTPAVPDAVLTELQVTFNKTSDLQLQAIYEMIPDEAQRVELLKLYAKTLKMSAKTGKDTETARAKFFHASAVLGVVPNTVW